MIKFTGNLGGGGDFKKIDIINMGDVQLPLILCFCLNDIFRLDHSGLDEYHFL